MSADKFLSRSWEIVKRPVLDPGVLFGVASMVFMARTGMLYAVVMGVFVILSVIAGASPLRARVPAIGMWVSAVGQMLAAFLALVQIGWPEAAPVFIPFTLYGLANVFNGYELSYPRHWQRLPSWLRVVIVGEMFAVIGTGFLLYFLSASGISYFVTMASTILAAIFVLMDRSDVSRLVLGIGAGATAMIALLAGGVDLGVAASFVLSFASLRVWWLKRTARLKTP